MFNYDRAIYKTIDDDQWNTTLLKYHSGIYKTIYDEIETMFNYDIAIYIKQ